MIYQYSLSTEREGFYDITGQVKEALKKAVSKKAFALYPVLIQLLRLRLTKTQILML